MLCEHANAQLVEYAAHELPADISLQVAEHVRTCTTCQADLDSINTLQQMSEQWQAETPPAWAASAPVADRGYGGGWLAGFRLWFPTLASSSALVLAAVLFFQQPGTQGVLPSEPGSVNYDNLPPLPQAASQAALVQSVLESSQEQRAKEIQALLKVLKAEMDKRSIQTEESLRYIITHQMQGQQELDELYRQVEKLMTEELAGKPAGGAQTPGNPQINNGSM